MVMVAGLLNTLPASATAFNPRPEVEEQPSVEGSNAVAQALEQDNAVAEAAVTAPAKVAWPEATSIDVDLDQSAARTLSAQENALVTVEAVTGEEFEDWEVPEHWQEVLEEEAASELQEQAAEEQVEEEVLDETVDETVDETAEEATPEEDLEATAVDEEAADSENGSATAREPEPSEAEESTPDEEAQTLAAPAQVEPIEVSEPEPVTSVQIEVLDQDQAEQIGVNGLLLRVSRTDDSPTIAPVELDIDYSDFAEAFGGDYASRLTMVEIDECVLDDSCDTGDTVSYDSAELLANDTHEQQVTARVSAAPQGALMALAAAPGGGNGDYAATQLSAASSWNVNNQSGDFSWSYDFTTPPAPSSLNPAIGLGYSSGGVDGRIATSNNQTSWIGDGFAYAPGAIERRYSACVDSGHETGDLCWNTDNVTLSMTGHSGALIKDDDGTYRLSNDDGTKVERLTGANNGAHNGEYWKVTTPDGTQYFFGQNRLPGWSSGDPETKSAQTLPIYATKSGQPCYNATFSQSWCQQANKWNLDHVVDVHGNVMTFYYDAETNHYGRNLTNTATPYVRAANVKRIEYGLRSDDVYATAPARVIFSSSERCLVTSSFDCAADKRTSGNAKHWPDVPLDQDCKSGQSCAGRHSPTFWSTKKLDAITTQIRVGGSYTDVDTWKLEHSFPEAGDGTGPTLWLDSIEHVGKVGGTEAMPKISFAGTQMPNRVDSPTDDIAPMLRWRITSIYTESGGQFDITYSQPECEPGKTPKPHENTKRCYPVLWTPEGGVELTDWFHKYVVTEVNEVDLVSDQPTLTTSYDYVGTPAWRYTEADGMVKDKYRTWADWRGYDRVIVRTGHEGEERTETEYLYFQGMHEDKQPSGKRSVSITDSSGEEHTDHKELSGALLETITRDGEGGQDISREIDTPWLKKTAEVKHSWGSQTAHMVRTEQVNSYVRLADGTWRHARLDHTFNDDGAITRTRDHGDVGVTGDEKCVHTTYVNNTDAHILNLVSRAETLAVDCGDTPNRPEDVITDERVAYDGGDPGDTPTHGLPTSTQKLDSYSNGEPVYQTVDQTEFDTFGNTVKEINTAGRVTTTEYGFTASGLPESVTETNPLGHSTTTTVDPARGLPVSETDANGRTMNMAYDPLGRVTSVWLPDRDPATDTPTAKFEYHVRQDGPTSITTHTLQSSTEYVTGHEIFDAFLRPRQTQSPAPGGGRLVTDTFHDTRGQVVKERAPYYNAEEPTDTLFVVANDAEIPRQGVTVYDGVGRVTDNLHVAFGEERWRTSTEHHGDRTLITPPDGGTAVTSIVDVQGRLTEVRTHHGGTPEGDYDAIAYTYAKNDQLATVTDPEGNVWQYTYDMRGRLVRTDDPISGATTMGYNELDQLVTTSDARGQTLAYGYDEIGRQVGLYEDSSQGEKRAEWVYDTLAKGHLTSSTRYTDGEPYTTRVVRYDQFYRPTTTEIRIPDSEAMLSGRYRFSTQYNFDGSVRALTLPAAGGLGQETIAYSYNELGMPTHMSSRLDDYVTDTVYSNTGELRQIALDTGVSAAHTTWMTWDYDTATGRLAETTLVPERGITGSLVHQHYTYDDAGNVLNLRDEPTADHLQTDVQCFSYDHMRRMTGVWTPDASGEQACAAEPTASALGGAAPYWHEYTYDTLGNRETEVQHGGPGGDITRTYTHGGAAGVAPQALTQVEESGPAGDRLETYSYDEAGNMIGRTTASRDQELEWDVEGNLAQVTEEDGSQTSYTYDADGQRLIREDPTSTTLYLPGMELRLDKEDLVQEATRFYSHAGQTVAVRQNDGTLTWMHADHHGTGQVAVNARTGEETRRYTTAFGVDRESHGEWPSDRGFVGGTIDASTGLTQLGARAYDADLGRFISVDPIMDVTDHQQMHGYVYSNNNPVTFTDPTGLFWAGESGSRYATSRISPAAQLVHDRWLYNQQHNNRNNPVALQKATERYNQNVRGGFRSTSTGSRGGGTTYQSQKGPSQAYLNAQREKEEAQRKLVAAATGLAKLVADELGITAGLECFTTGDLGACGETALNVAMMFVGGLPAKLAAKYGLRWGKAAELGRRISALGGDLIDGIKDLNKANKKMQASCPIGNSFVPGTAVVMADGSTKPIEDVDIGEKVLATDPETGEQSARTVLATIIGSGAKSLVQITIDPTSERDVPEGDGAGSGEESEGVPGPVVAGDVIMATDGHPFWVPDLGLWVDAIDLAPGMWLQTSSGTWVQVSAVQPWTQSATVHNLTVQGVHTYHVATGSLDVLAHNCKVTISDGAIDHAWNKHRAGGEYHNEGRTENVLSSEIADKGQFRGLVESVAENGSRSERSSSDPREGYYLDQSFDEPEIGLNGQNGLRLFIKGDNFTSVAPRYMY
ncbi:RHS repeat-associated core domain-containing protein [Nocardiopsis ganjiahuensis]|uniref:RHS repeat-associated core domain-containing protein n=1 Tax=Nocardiopsis ganjiahuensis TaxID=239984 RepID=UPI00035E38DF|nr:RHS repeat-associated core domain-containing protein [Nocardiopsis ganjiahuensis]